MIRRIRLFVSDALFGAAVAIAPEPETVVDLLGPDKKSSAIPGLDAMIDNARAAAAPKAVGTAEGSASDTATALRHLADAVERGECRSFLVNWDGPPRALSVGATWGVTVGRA